MSEQNTQPSVARFDCEMLYERNGDARPGMTLTKSGDWVRYESHKAELRAAVESNQRLTEALEKIALAGMAPSPEISENGVEAWHARQAWSFIGIAARAITPSGASNV